ncbi:hypothetical protein U9M48_005911 [Paspalum notatum var. saurae]|uniref:Plant heme peroxidase family profile domain-containing protein n=1 Tax=Paspalum notatum var. saurae TaxID=547442 RepID=A0AAQ3PXP2_PASNO
MSRTLHLSSGPAPSLGRTAARGYGDGEQQQQDGVVVAGHGGRRAPAVLSVSAAGDVRRRRGRERGSAAQLLRRDVPGGGGDRAARGAWAAGAHTIGRAHCTAFSARLYNFSGTGAADPSLELDAAFLARLRHACPASSSLSGSGRRVHPGLVAPMDPHTPYALDTLYYWGVLRSRGLFASDQALLRPPPRRSGRPPTGPTRGSAGFAAAIVKMGQIQVLTGTSGQVRAKCGGVNQLN